MLPTVLDPSCKEFGGRFRALAEQPFDQTLGWRSPINRAVVIAGDIQGCLFLAVPIGNPVDVGTAAKQALRGLTLTAGARLIKGHCDIVRGRAWVVREVGLNARHQIQRCRVPQLGPGAALDGAEPPAIGRTPLRYLAQLIERQLG